MSNNNPTQIIGGEAAIGHRYMPGRIATPTFVNMQDPAGNLLITVVGGQTRLEVVATQIAAELVAVEKQAKNVSRADFEKINAFAVEMAADLINRCEAAFQPQEEKT